VRRRLLVVVTPETIRYSRASSNLFGAFSRNHGRSLRQSGNLPISRSSVFLETDRKTPTLSPTNVDVDRETTRLTTTKAQSRFQIAGQPLFGASRKSEGVCFQVGAKRVDSSGHHYSIQAGGLRVVHRGLRTFRVAGRYRPSRHLGSMSPNW